MGKGKNRKLKEERRKEKKEKTEQKEQKEFQGFAQNIRKLETPFIRDTTDLKKGLTVVSRSTQYNKVPDVEVHFDEEVFRKIQVATRLLNVEITGLGTVKKISPGKYLVDSIYLFDQIVSGGACRMASPMAIADLCQRVEADGKDPADLKFWWHSHNSMGVTPSQTDEAMGREYCSNGYLISLVTNHHGDYYCKMNVYGELEVVITAIPMFVASKGYDESLIESVKQDIQKYVRQEGYQTPVYHPHYHSDWHPNGLGIGPLHESQVGADPVESKEAKTPIQDAREAISNINKQADNGGISAQTADEPIDGPVNPHPFGADFIEDGIHYVWDEDKGYYRFFMVNADKTDGRELNEVEVVQYGGENYNMCLQYLRATEVEGG